MTTMGGGSGGATTDLKRELGLGSSTALVIGNMVGSGVFLLPASLAGVVLVSGSSSLFAWVFTGIGAMLLAAVFATLGRAYPRTGGPYEYSRRAFGDLIGFLTAWGYWIAAWVGNAAIATAFVGYLAAALDIPELADDNVLAAAVAVTAIWVLTAVNAIGVKQAGWVQAVTTVLKFVPLAVIGIIGLFFIDGSNFTPVAPEGWGLGDGALGGITLAATLTLWAFIGLESATVPAEEVRDPKRTIPRASILGTVVTTLVYIVATVAIVGIIPAARLADSTSPFAEAAREIFGGNWGRLAAVVAVISTFGALNGWILLQGRIPLAAAQDGLFPKMFARVSERTRTPVLGLVVSSLLITVLVGSNYQRDLVDLFTYVILLATLVTLIPYAFAAAAELYLLFADREAFSGRRMLGSGVVAALAFAYSYWTIVGSGYEITGQGFLLVLAGIPVYVLIRWRRGREPHALAVPEVSAIEVRETRPAPAGANAAP
jgi:APA family basic amino acid/polyamine antiporter